MTPCQATHGDLVCCRTNDWTRDHPAPHMDPSGEQWDQHGIRQARGNDPWKGEVA